jgi:hypothetical protein
MTTQITIRNKQADNLLIYIEKYKAKFEERLVAYNAVGQLEWNAGSWRFGEKGVAWLKETKDRGFKWDEVSSRVKALTNEYFFGFRILCELITCIWCVSLADYHQVLH